MAATLSTTSIASLAAQEGQTVTGFLTGLAAMDAQPSDVVPFEPGELPVPKQEQLDALRRLPELLASVKLPDRRREMTEDEEKAVSELLSAVSHAQKLLKDTREQGLKPALFAHLDRQAELDGVAGRDTPTNPAGHYLVGGKGPGYAREYRAGTPSLDPEELAVLRTQGEITHQDFLGMTKQVRVVDPVGLLKFIAKNPTKLGAIRRAVKFARQPAVSLTVK